uniref:MCM C-terminal AAA(+) ATPase domain-containing protein n=1 Tax=Chaetoceros debilis TaxID=122233 RepID=A0A7S3Q1V3_9STRA
MTVRRRVSVMQRDSGTGDQVAFTLSEEAAFRLLAHQSDVYDILSRSMAPSISGSYTHDIKKAMVCQLFSGLSKKITDEMRMRGKINELLLVIFPWPRVNVWGSAARLMESVAKD